jgi:transposase
LAVLRTLADSGKLPSKFAIRLLVILNRAAGKTPESISEFLAVSLSSVIRYVKRFNSDGLESLLKVRITGSDKDFVDENDLSY